MTEKNEFQPIRDLTYDFIIQKYKRQGLELTMAEAVRLREILKECREQQKEIKNFGENGFEITNEAETRFFQEIFGVDIVGYLRGVRDSKDFEKRMHDLMHMIKTRYRGKTEML